MWFGTATVVLILLSWFTFIGSLRFEAIRIKRQVFMFICTLTKIDRGNMPQESQTIYFQQYFYVISIEKMLSLRINCLALHVVAEIS